MVNRRNLGEMLLAANLIDEVQMKIALAEQEQSGKKFGSTLVDLKFMDENVLAAFLSKQIDVPCISLLHIDVPKKVLRKLNRKLARECQAVPVKLDEGRLAVAMADPTDIGLIEQLETELGMIIVPMIAPQSSIMKMIDRCYPPDFNDDDTLSRRASLSPLASGDPIFHDLIEELENGDYEARLTRIEQKLDQVWTLLEKVLRALEGREGSASERSRTRTAEKPHTF